MIIYLCTQQLLVATAHSSLMIARIFFLFLFCGLASLWPPPFGRGGTIIVRVQYSFSLMMVQEVMDDIPTMMIPSNIQRGTTVGGGRVDKDTTASTHKSIRTMER